MADQVSQGGITVAADPNVAGYRVNHVSQGGITVPAELVDPTVRVSQGGITVAACGPISAPTGFAATKNGYDIVLTWTDNEATNDYYRVDYSSDGLVWSTLSDTIAGDAETYTHAGPIDAATPCATIFYYRLYTLIEGPCEGVYTPQATTYTLVVPTTPTNLDAVLSGPNSVMISWTDAATNEDAYLLEFSKDGGGWTTLANLPADTASYEHTSLTYGSVYLYRVSAVAGGCSATSGTASITIPVPVSAGTLLRAGAAAMAMLVIHRGYDGSKLNEFIGRGRRGPTLGGLRYAGYYKRMRTPGAWTLGFNAHDERVLDFKPYHIVEFWLRDMFGGSEYEDFLASLPPYRKDPLRPHWYRDFTGFVLTEPTLSQSADGTYTSAIQGRGLNELLYSEYIDYAPGTSQAEKSGVAETVAKEFVDENIGPGAGLDAGGYSRVRDGLSIEADGASGGTWEGERSRKLLGDVLQEIGDTASGPGDYMIIQTAPALFQYQWRSPHWGLDKRYGNGVRRPALFSARLGNIEDLTSSISYLGAASGVIVYGQGVGSTLKPGTAYDTTLTTQTSWARKVLIRQQRSTVGQTSLNDAAYAELRDNWPEISVDGTVKQILSSRYNVHWGLGDLVTAEDTIYGRRVNRKILGIRLSLEIASQQSGGLITVTPELGDFIDV